MNSLNILSARVSPSNTPSPSRNSSLANVLSAAAAAKIDKDPSIDLISERSREQNTEASDSVGLEPKHDGAMFTDEKGIIENQPIASGWTVVPRQFPAIFISSIRWIFSTLAAPGVYLIACLYDERGRFSPFSQLQKLGTCLIRTSKHPTNPRPVEAPSMDSEVSAENASISKGISSRQVSGNVTRRSSSSSIPGLASESESDLDRSVSRNDRSIPLPRGSRSKSSQLFDEIAPARRSIRIKLHNEGNLRQRKQKRLPESSAHESKPGSITISEILPATLKSPTSPAASLLMTKYPRAPAPPRPLLPRRQPSYTLPDVVTGRLTQKTLILDLDETLIHSMAKGGRMSTGHMVEVRLSTLTGTSIDNTAGPQHPILYYVHKRPHCDDFLRRICKWYNLVIFTASVQEYADPVIDWLEQERKFFSGRFYRQHCTYRHGAFIKDLSSVEPDLSKVMILDNSPLSYMFHQDNAIPIEGWISDPTDNDLLHLVPLLEGLQYVTDVRAFLALRGGEDGKHT